MYQFSVPICHTNSEERLPRQCPAGRFPRLTASKFCANASYWLHSLCRVVSAGKPLRGQDTCLRQTVLILPSDGLCLTLCLCIRPLTLIAHTPRLVIEVRRKYYWIVVFCNSRVSIEQYAIIGRIVSWYLKSAFICTCVPHQYNLSSQLRDVYRLIISAGQVDSQLVF